MSALSIDTSMFHDFVVYLTLNTDKVFIFGESVFITEAIFAFAALLMYIYFKGFKPLIHKLKHSNKPKKKPSLISSYIKAKKDKVCPLIKFID